MNEQFLRKVVVDIIPQNGTEISINSDESRVRLNPSDLRINFKCTKTTDTKCTPNQAVIDFYNLSQNTRNALEQQNTIVKLTVGYLGLTPPNDSQAPIAGNPGIGTIFIGDVQKVKHDKKKKFELAVKNKLENTDLITSVDVGDGNNQYRNAFLDKGYAANVQLKQILTDLVNAMGLNVGAFVKIPTVSYIGSFATSGLVRDELDYICSANGLEWSIQNQAVNIIPKTGTTNATALYVSPQTGLIAPPNLTTFGVEFKTLCDHRMIPGTLVQISSEFIPGNPKPPLRNPTAFYKIKTVVHRGSNWDGDFVSEVQAVSGPTTD